MAKFLDNETQEMAALALRNAFWYDFSDLCEVYVQAVEGLTDIDPEHQRQMMGDLTSIYGTSGREPKFTLPPVESRDSIGKVTEHKTIYEALTCASALEVWLRGEKIAEKHVTTGWFFL